MKNIQHIGSSYHGHHRTNNSNHERRTPKQNLSTGSVADLYPVVLDGGRTVIYITDKNKESEIRFRYSSRNKPETGQLADLKL
jgi:hypothetical protein